MPARRALGTSSAVRRERATARACRRSRRRPRRPPPWGGRARAPANTTATAAAVGARPAAIASPERATRSAARRASAASKTTRGSRSSSRRSSFRQVRTPKRCLAPLICFPNRTRCTGGVGAGPPRRDNPAPVTGTVTLRDGDGSVEVAYNIVGLAPGSTHGFHVHEAANFSDGCEPSARRWISSRALSRPLSPQGLCQLCLMRLPLSSQVSRPAAITIPLASHTARPTLRTVTLVTSATLSRMPPAPRSVCSRTRSSRCLATRPSSGGLSCSTRPSMT